MTPTPKRSACFRGRRPDVFANDIFAIKHGDQSVRSGHVAHIHAWEQALREISDEIDAVDARLSKIGLAVRNLPSRDLGDMKLIVATAGAQVKVQVQPERQPCIQPLPIGLTRAQPDWKLLESPHAAQLPALRWKLANLETFRKRRAADFEQQAKALKDNFSRPPNQAHSKRIV